MGKRQHTRKHHIQERLEVSPFQASNHKVARNRQDSMARNTNNKKDPQKKRRLGTASKKITGHNILHRTQHTTKNKVRNDNSSRVTF